jgi:putative transposase
MKRTRFTETQIVKALKEYEGGRKADDICRDLQISKATLYNWNAKYGGMESSDVKRMKELEEENARLKRMYANLAMDNEIYRHLFTKKAGPCHQKTIE